jgi:hypothetical protein
MKKKCRHAKVYGLYQITKAKRKYTMHLNDLYQQMLGRGWTDPARGGYQHSVQITYTQMHPE